MDVGTWLHDTTQVLLRSGIETARLDCLVLLEDILNKNRTQLLAYPEETLTKVQLDKLNQYIVRRAKHEPLAYIRGHTEFFGRTFLVDKNVLEPRPESETMLEMLLAAALPVRPHIADMGTGSGALGITAALELPTARVDLIDIDRAALAVAEKNVNMFSIKAKLLQNDLLVKMPESYDVILANLPYVPDNFHINPAAQAEPRIAIFGGPDGLDLYRRMFAQIALLPRKPEYVFTEALPPQHEKLTFIAKDAGLRLTARNDFIQQFEPAKPNIPKLYLI
jgi:release factor glutamine methyltransferase